MAKIGWAYDLKTVTPMMVKNRIERTGDGTVTNIWGWADPDQTEDERKNIKIIAKSLN